jgi:hypothetical protein
MLFNKKTSLGALAGLLLVACSAQAEDAGKPIGYVMKTSGEAFVVTDGVARPATVGMPLRVGSSLRTGPAGTLGVTFEDSTLMSFGPNSELKVDEYLYEPAKGELKLNANISRGTLNYISGVIAKLKPEAVEVHTPTGTIGVRGTHFLVKVAEAGR